MTITVIDNKSVRKKSVTFHEHVTVHEYIREDPIKLCYHSNFYVNFCKKFKQFLKFFKKGSLVSE